MTAKRLVVSPQAERDARAAALFYRQEGGEGTAIRFLQMLQQQYGAIARDPGIGSPRYALELGLAGLRHRSLKHFPYLVFYVEFVDRVEVWRLLHARRDLPASLRE